MPHPVLMLYILKNSNVLAGSIGSHTLSARP